MEAFYSNIAKLYSNKIKTKVQQCQPQCLISGTHLKSPGPQIAFKAHTSCLLSSFGLHPIAATWWTFHSIDISKCFCVYWTGLRLQLFLNSLRNSDPAPWYQNPTSFYGSFNFGAFTATEAVHWSLLASFSAKSQLLYMTHWCLRNQYHLWNSYTWPSLAAAQGTTLATSVPQLLCADPKETLLRKFCLSYSF